MLEERKIDLYEDWSDLSHEERIQALKSTVTVVELAELMGFEPNSRGKITSPWNPDDKTPSCHLYDDHFYDYSTGKGGDIFDFVQALRPGTSMRDAMWAIRTGALRAGKEVGDVELTKPQELEDFTEAFREQGDELEYFDGLYLGGMGVRIVRPSGDILIPHSEPGRTYGVKVRYGAGGKGSWAGSQYSHRLYDPVGWPDDPRPAPYAILCEGESDSWAMISTFTGADVYALPAGVQLWRDHWLEDLEPYDQVYVCMDNDKPGHEARDRIIRKIGWGRALELPVPQLYNDAREAIKAGWDPSSRLG